MSWLVKIPVPWAVLLFLMVVAAIPAPCYGGQDRPILARVSQGELGLLPPPEAACPVSSRVLAKAQSAGRLFFGLSEGSGVVVGNMVKTLIGGSDTVLAGSAEAGELFIVQRELVSHGRPVLIACARFQLSGDMLFVMQGNTQIPACIRGSRETWHIFDVHHEEIARIYASTVDIDSLFLGNLLTVCSDEFWIPEDETIVATAVEMQ
jgi:hypothetical protein